MKIIGRVIVGFVALVAIALLVVSLNLDRIVKRTVEENATKSLRLNTTLGGAHLSILGGKLHLGDLRIASPHGFSAPHMLQLGGGDVAVRYGELRKQPIHIESIVLDKPALVIEQHGGSLNFRKAMELMPPSDKSEPPMKMIVDELTIKDARVSIRPGLPGVADQIEVPIPSLTLRDIGGGKGARNGAAIKDVAMTVITALAGAAAQSSQVPPQLKALLHSNVAGVAAQLGGEAQKQIAAAIPGPLGSALSKASPGALAKDPSQALQGLAGEALGGTGAAPKPAGRSNSRDRVPPRR